METKPSINILVKNKNADFSERGAFSTSPESSIAVTKTTGFYFRKAELPTIN